MYGKLCEEVEDVKAGDYEAVQCRIYSFDALPDCRRFCSGRRGGADSEEGEGAQRDEKDCIKRA